MHVPEPTFPPILAASRVAAPTVPFEAAVAGATRGALRAGDLLWSTDDGRAALALVLEPEVGRQTALQMAPLMFVAVADCLGALMPPHTSVLLRWPGTVLVNAGEAGSIKLAMASAPDAEPPEWLVIGADLQFASLDDIRETGDAADRTALADEGIGELAPDALLCSLAAHFLTWLDIWQDRGFQVIQQQLVGSVEGHDTDAVIRHGDESIIGRVVGIDDSVGLEVKPASQPVRKLAYMDVLRRAAP